MTADAGSLDLDDGLRSLGFTAFRPGQREAIETLLDRGRLLLVAPTGGGKSLIYQLPAAILPGTTLVVSPLISLMHDQVLALEERGVAATYLASTVETDEMRRRVTEAARGAYKLIYVAPERLTFDGFRGLLQRINCPLVAIDEAHCISEWGHDFRPEYMQIGEVLRQLPHARVLACTATATPVVRDEIIERLDLPASDTPQLVYGFARPNLALRVMEVTGRREAETQVSLLLGEWLKGPRKFEGTGIVYAPTRKRTDEMAQRLKGTGWACEGYHAGMSGEERDRVQRSFASGDLEIVVATNAFGMGIDRPDVRCIAHLAPPGSVEAYYQEAGRAGRDGKDAACLLLISPGDMALRRYLIESDTEGRAPSPETVGHKWNLFLELMRYAEGGGCRHDAILRYFGDEAETLSGCGKCDVCRQLDGEADADADVATIVRKALCGVARVHGKFGIQAAVKLLKGAPDRRLGWSGLEETPTFGTLSEYSEEWLLRLLRRCVTAGWADFTGGNRPMVVLTKEGNDVIHERRPARLLLPPKQVRKAAAGGGERRRPSLPSSAPEEELDTEAQQLFEALRTWRVETAREESVPAYVVASDRSLRDIARLKPKTSGQLELAHGIGPAKVEKYGERILAIVASE